jgi:hypothetical protein
MDRLKETRACGAGPVFSLALCYPQQVFFEMPASVFISNIDQLLSVSFALT